MEEDKGTARQLDCCGRFLDLSKPQIMGVLNITPDSFSDGGNFYKNLKLALDHARSMVDQGATIIDVGGESTRPGAAEITIQQEMDRVLPVVEGLIRELPVVVSVDTSTPELMMAAAGAGAGIINDVRALTLSGALEAAVKLQIPVCLMHMRGEPGTMQDSPAYESVVEEVRDYLQQRAELCVRAGIAAERLLIDPGFGFGKSLQHNLALLNRLDEFVAMGWPVLVGLSRKSMLGEVLGKPVNERLFGSITAAALAVYNGATIIRCHDVAETADAIKLVFAVMSERGSI